MALRAKRPVEDEQSRRFRQELRRSIQKDMPIVPEQGDRIDQMIRDNIERHGA